jgi:hypothetical protein
MESAPFSVSGPDKDLLSRLYQSVRGRSCALAIDLSDADATVQSMPEASPAKWHLAHTTWFFEGMVLAAYAPHYHRFDSRFEYLFNSYYETIGPRHARPKRGLLSRPSLSSVYVYREHVDEAMAQVLRGFLDSQAQSLIELGCHHEQQHQELLLTDILHAFSENPTFPTYRSVSPRSHVAAAEQRLTYTTFNGGTVQDRSPRPELRVRLRRPTPSRVP